MGCFRNMAFSCGVSIISAPPKLQWYFPGCCMYSIRSLSTLSRAPESWSMCCASICWRQICTQMFCVHVCVYAESWSQTVRCMWRGQEQQFGEKRLQSKHRLFLWAALSLWPDLLCNALSLISLVCLLPCQSLLLLNDSLAKGWNLYDLVLSRIPSPDQIFRGGAQTE